MISQDAVYGQMRSSYPLLRNLLPHHGNLDLELVIRETATEARIRRCNTWQDAWNTASGATSTRPGWFEFWANVTCPGCNGKRIDMRRGTACIQCAARGRIRARIRQQALYAAPPVASSTRTEQ